MSFSSSGQRRQVALNVVQEIQLGNNANDKYSFKFTKVKGSSDSFPVLKTFAAYFRPSPQALAITKHTKNHMEILSPLAKGISMSENLNLKMGFSYFQMKHRRVHIRNTPIYGEK